MARGSSPDLDFPGQSGQTVSIEADVVPFSISSITPDHGSNLGSVTLTVEGAKFQANEKVEVIAADGTVRDATTIRWVDGTTMWATFDLRGLATGQYDVRVEDDTRSTTLAKAFEVNNGPAGHVAVHLILPKSVRSWQSGVVQVDYTNDGQTDVAAPLLDLQVEQALMHSGTETDSGSSEKTFLGTSASGPAGVLQPGAHGSQSYTFKPAGAFRDDTLISFTVSALDPSASIDFSSIKDLARPAGIDFADWDQI